MRVNVYIDRQRLDLRDDAGRVVETYPVSTAKNGPGERYGSECTPRGLHVVRAKIGAGCALNTVFVRRRPTNTVLSAQPTPCSSGAGRPGKSGLRSSRRNIPGATAW